MMQINRETAKELVSTIKDPTPFFIETTKEFVDFALELNTHNRKTRKHHILKFADDMCNGNWTPSCQGVGFSLDNWLIDGQHRLLANKAAGYPPIPLLVVFGLPAVAQINVDNVVPRTTANMLELARGANASTLSAAALLWMMKIRDNFKGSANNKVGTQAERLAAYDEYYESINDVLKSTEQKGFTAAFFAPLAYLRHFGVSLHRISAFRDGCMSGEDLSKGDPRLTWRKKCLGLPARGGNATLMVFNYTVMAVDKFIRKESLSVLPNAAYEVELCRENVARLNKLIRDFGNDKESGAIQGVEDK